jgi:hypothetical protein
MEERNGGPAHVAASVALPHLRFRTETPPQRVVGQFERGLNYVLSIPR